MKYLALLLCIPLFGCSTAQVKRSGQGISTATFTAAATLVNPLVGIGVGLVNFMGWELVMEEDKTEDVQRQLDSVTKEYVDRQSGSFKEWVKGLFWTIGKVLGGLVLLYFVLKFLVKRYITGPKGDQAIEDWEDRLLRKAVDKVKTD
jgi:hypothetical protein